MAVHTPYIPEMYVRACMILHRMEAPAKLYHPKYACQVSGTKCNKSCVCCHASAAATHWTGATGSVVVDQFVLAARVVEVARNQQ
jgi:hypothetical protein